MSPPETISVDYEMMSQGYFAGNMLPRCKISATSETLSTTEDGRLLSSHSLQRQRRRFRTKNSTSIRNTIIRHGPTSSAFHSHCRVCCLKHGVINLTNHDHSGDSKPSPARRSSDITTLKPETPCILSIPQSQYQRGQHFLYIKLSRIISLANIFHGILENLNILK